MERMDVSSSKAGSFPCDLCEVVCTSQQVYDGHLSGAKHQKKVKRQELERLWEIKDPSVFCSVCQLALEPTLMEMHMSGSKHKSNAGGEAKEQKQKSNAGGKAKAKGQKSPKTQKVANKKKDMKIKCNLCSVVLNSMSLANDHFNSKTHEMKCAKKYLKEKRLNAQADPENCYFCDTCDISLNGEDTYNTHLQGFKHNNKLMKGNFDPNSPFAAKTQKLKAKMEKFREVRKLRKLNKQSA